MDYQHWLREAISQLQASESPRRDAEILLEFVTGKGRTFILAFGETVLTEASVNGSIHYWNAVSGVSRWHI